jgi:hypothetical protein
MIAGFNLIPVTDGHFLWPAVSAFIRTTYRRHYRARLKHLPRRIVALVGPGEWVQCVAGLRDCTEPFLSEHYLDQPIESVLMQATGLRVERREIVEVSSLASRSQIALVAFVRELIRYGASLDFDWAFFTATDRLEKILRRIELPLIELGDARPERLANRELWGSYYERHPKVFAIGRCDLAPFLCTGEADRERRHRLGASRRTDHYVLALDRARIPELAGISDGFTDTPAPPTERVAE